MRTFKEKLEEARTPDGVEIAAFITSMQNLVTRYKSGNKKAADIYHDVMKKGKFVDWLQKNVEPIWEKHGYAELGSARWGKMQQEVIQKFLLDK